jgi:hypothetical protein
MDPDPSSLSGCSQTQFLIFTGTPHSRCKWYIRKYPFQCHSEKKYDKGKRKKHKTSKKKEERGKDKEGEMRKKGERKRNNGKRKKEKMVFKRVK